MKELKLNLGCGDKIVNGWVNVDYSYGARLAKIPLVGYIIKQFGIFNVKWDKQIFIHDLTKPFPWKDNTASVIYSSHTLEHMDRENGKIFLKECYRVLKPNGIIRVVVPDFFYDVDRYVKRLLPAEYFLEEIYVLRGKPPQSFIKRIFWPYMGFPHQCMYDTDALIRLITDAGFDTKCESYANSKILDIREIEIKERTVNAVIVEGYKKNF